MHESLLNIQCVLTVSVSDDFPPWSMLVSKSYPNSLQTRHVHSILLISSPLNPRLPFQSGNSSFLESFDLKHIVCTSREAPQEATFSQRAMPRGYLCFKLTCVSSASCEKQFFLLRVLTVDRRLYTVVWLGV